MEVAKTVKLNSGYEMPTVGLGTWTMWKVCICLIDRHSKIIIEQSLSFACAPEANQCKLRIRILF